MRKLKRLPNICSIYFQASILTIQTNLRIQKILDLVFKPKQRRTRCFCLYLLNSLKKMFKLFVCVVRTIHFSFVVIRISMLYFLAFTRTHSIVDSWYTNLSRSKLNAIFCIKLLLSSKININKFRNRTWEYFTLNSLYTINILL